MEIEYDLTIEDILAFNEAHQNRSPVIRGIRLTLFGITWLAIPILIAVYLVRADDIGNLPRNWSRVMFLVLWGVVHFLVFGFLVLQIARTGRTFISVNFLTRLFITEGDTSSITGRRKLWVNPTTIGDSTPQGESSWKVSAVQKILITTEYAFIYVSSLQAFIVPRRAFFRPEEFERFVTLVEQYSGKSPIHA